MQGKDILNILIFFQEACWRGLKKLKGVEKKKNRRVPRTEHPAPITDYRLPITDHRSLITDHRLTPHTAHRKPPSLIQIPHIRLTQFAKQITHFYSLNAGGEIILDGFIKETIRRNQSKIDYKRFALTAGQDFLFGKVIFTQYLGFYVYSPFKAKNSVYQKYEIAYRIHKNLLLGVYLKAHTSDAELLGLNLSYLLVRKPFLRE